MDLAKQFSLIGLLFLGTIGAGVGVSRLGKPYHALWFNLHKLIALAGVVLVVIRLNHLDPLASFPPLALIWIGAAFASTLAMFISGALLSIQQEISRSLQLVHQISAGMIAVFSVAALYILQ